MVSKNPTEDGIEYLAPFHDKSTKKLVGIAGVQVRFVKGGPPDTWGSINVGAVESLKPFAKLGFAPFPVILTTVDQERVKPCTETVMKDSVSFLETATFQWTLPLGILRLHTEKLGSVVSKSFPFLRKSVGGLSQS